MFKERFLKQGAFSCHENDSEITVFLQMATYELVFIGNSDIDRQVLKMFRAIQILVVNNVIHVMLLSIGPALMIILVRNHII